MAKNNKGFSRRSFLGGLDAQYKNVIKEFNKRSLSGWKKHLVKQCF